MTFEFEISAGDLKDHMSRAAFCTDIRDIILEIKDGYMETFAVGVVNDRVSEIQTILEHSPEKNEIFGIPNIPGVIDKIGNFNPGDKVSVILDNNNQMKIIRKKPKKTYTISTVADIKHIRSKCMYNIWPDLEKMEFHLKVKGKPIQMAGKIEAIMSIPNLSEVQKIFKNKDVFTDETELIFKLDGTIGLRGIDEEDIGSDEFQVDMTTIPKNDIVKGYSGLIEVIKALNSQAEIMIYGGNGAVSLMITEKMDTPEKKYNSMYIIMSRVLRWK